MRCHASLAIVCIVLAMPDLSCWLAGVSSWHAVDSSWLARSCSGWLDLLVSWQDVLPGYIMARVISRRLYHMESTA